jgi:hypothetical protein
LIIDNCTAETLSDSLYAIIANYSNIVADRLTRARYARLNYSWDKLIDMYEGLLHNPA